MTNAPPAVDPRRIRRRRPRRFPLRVLGTLAAALLLPACGGETKIDESVGRHPDLQGASQAVLPELDSTQMEPQVKERLLETRAAALGAARSAEAWGRYGMVAHAHELWKQAAEAYRKAEQLDPRDPRWPYYLGDVLSVQGTELEQSAVSFRRALELRPNYAPAHMRLGKVLIELDRSEEAAAELVRALELAPELQQARVALAQVRLAQEDLEESERLLLKALETEPRHGQALTTLGRVYMRQGRRDDARQVAERARDAASYNLFSDPLMAQVVAEGVSTVQIWERAKSFFEQGDYEQAVLGLRRVVSLQPDNVDALLQLAVAHGNLGELERARFYLERVVALDPEQVEPRLDLAQLMLTQGRAGAAVEQLRRARALAPERLEVEWLLGRSLLETGDLEGALQAFENAERAEIEAPSWALSAWGRALALDGRPEEALLRLRAALRRAPNDPEALFYAGLVLEGLGRLDEAVTSYCRSLAERPASPASARLRELRRSCP